MSVSSSPRSFFALLLLAGFTAGLCPTSAGAGTYYKSERRRSQTPPAEVPSASSPRRARVDSVSSPQTMTHGSANQLIQRAASMLGAIADGVPPRMPADVTHLGHERRQLDPAAAALATAGSPRERGAASLRYANALAQLGYDADAALGYQQALQHDPGLTAAELNVGALLRRAGMLVEARSLLRDVLSREPASGLGWFNLALTEDRLQNGKASDEAYLQALRLDPSLWLPTKNPLIVGNERANAAIHRNYLERQGGDKILLDGGP